MILLIPDGIPRPAIAEAIAHLGLVLEAGNPANSMQRAIWATDAICRRRYRECDADNYCTAPAVVKIGSHSYCARHGQQAINHD